MKRVGIIGYGQMGAAMAPRLASDARRVVATDVDPQRCEAARQAGYLAQRVEVESTPIVILALPGPQEVLAATRGRFGTNQLIVDTTSIDPATALAVAEDVGSRGATYVEAPVLGGPPQVGRWVFLFGGSPEAVKAAASMLAPVGDGEYMGDVGSGSEAKLLNNILTGVHAAAVAEVLRLAHQLRMDVARLQHAIMRSDSAGRNPVLEIRVPKILNGTLGDTFSIANMTKDLALALTLPVASVAPPRLAKAAHDLFFEAQQNGWGTRDIGWLAAALDAVAERVPTESTRSPLREANGTPGIAGVAKVPMV